MSRKRGRKAGFRNPVVHLGAPRASEDRVTESAVLPVCVRGHEGGRPAAQRAHRSRPKD